MFPRKATLLRKKKQAHSSGWPHKASLAQLGVESRGPGKCQLLRVRAASSMAKAACTFGTEMNCLWDCERRREETNGESSRRSR